MKRENTVLAGSDARWTPSPRPPLPRLEEGAHEEGDDRRERAEGRGWDPAALFPMKLSRDTAREPGGLFPLLHSVLPVL